MCESLPSAGAQRAMPGRQTPMLPLKACIVQRVSPAALQGSEAPSWLLQLSRFPRADPSLARQETTLARHGKRNTGEVVEAKYTNARLNR